MWSTASGYAMPTASNSVAMRMAGLGVVGATGWDVVHAVWLRQVLVCVGVQDLGVLLAIGFAANAQPDLLDAEWQGPVAEGVAARQEEGG